MAGYVGYAMDTPAEQQNLLDALGAMTVGAVTSVVGGVLVNKTAGLIGRAIGKTRPSTGCPNSFIPGTRVLMADGTTKPIEHVQIGDTVLATDPENGKTAAKSVTAVINGNGTKNLVRFTKAASSDQHSGFLGAYNKTRDASAFLILNGVRGNGPALTDSVTATEGHPIWVSDLGDWIPAEQLQPGTWLQTSAGTHVQIAAITRWTSPHQTVHNLTIADFHTYYVLAGSQEILVHNCGEQLDFAHGTTTKHAQNIAAKGLSSPAAKEASSGGSVGQPGNFFTYSVAGPADTNLSVAAQWGVTRNGGSRDGASVVITQMCKCTYNRLVSEGHITSRVTGEGMPAETIFRPGALPFLRVLTHFSL
ncbi:polymorphic toxin-type HINT domain-containing protein [Acrocarpospora catenulata]|uniref:polymorphic toxin-type HINT domain-containing protein n=1 Tax=Acrocarpospora catenulata TaxID=2836182 RepID=UPI001BDAE086|nr:polymorphic toxin-type HINT domain-containing protein [Acrocarpospora catenulata]